VASLNGALQPWIRKSGNDAPEPSRFTAYAGVVATKPNASANEATFASFENLIYFPLFVLEVLTRGTVCKLGYQKSGLKKISPNG
jgi:hypothetical protein